VEGVAEGHGDEDEAARPDEVDAAVGQLLRVRDMLEDIAEQNGAGTEALEAFEVTVVEDVGLDVDALAFARVEVNEVNAAFPERRE
jgi:hypothetical protein